MPDLGRGDSDDTIRGRFGDRHDDGLAAALARPTYERDGSSRPSSDLRAMVGALHDQMIKGLDPALLLDRKSVV